MNYIKAAMSMLLLLSCGISDWQAYAQASAASDSRIVIESRGWQLVGDLRLPDTEARVPGVLMFNKAAGDRTVYEQLAHQLAIRGVASLRIDLPGHGESVNLGRFVPGETDSLTREAMIWESEVDVVAAHEFLKGHTRIDSSRIGMIGSSYSGEEMAEAGRKSGFAAAYVELSPGSFSEASINGIDSSGVAWLFVASKEERYLKEITAAVQANSRTVELIILPGTAHATRILEARPDMAERIAVWLEYQLR